MMYGFDYRNKSVLATPGDLPVIEEGTGDQDDEFDAASRDEEDDEPVRLVVLDFSPEDFSHIFRRHQRRSNSMMLLTRSQ